MSDPRTKEERCSCPSGSYSIKHTNACYEAQIERLRKDAARYRWIVTRPQEMTSKPIQEMWRKVNAEGRSYPTPEEWGAAFDAAMEESQS